MLSYSIQVKKLCLPQQSVDTSMRPTPSAVQSVKEFDAKAPLSFLVHLLPCLRSWAKFVPAIHTYTVKRKELPRHSGFALFCPLSPYRHSVRARPGADGVRSIGTVLPRLSACRLLM